MRKKMTREERKQAYLQNAEEMFDTLEDWYDANPDATFGEIELKAREGRRRMMGASLSTFINGRVMDKTEIPNCPTCGSRMKNKGDREKRVVSLEGETELGRAYFRCPHKCESGKFFPPR